MSKQKRIKLENDSEGGIVYSTNKNLAFEGLSALLGNIEQETTPDIQLLDVHIEKKGRGGKAAVIIKGFKGSNDALEELCKKLKTSMGVGGSAKDGEIIIQGDRRDKVMETLQKLGHKTKRVGG